MKICTKQQAPQQTYLQQLNAIARRAHAWAFILPVSNVAAKQHQHVTLHHAVRF